MIRWIESYGGNQGKWCAPIWHTGRFWPGSFIARLFFSSKKQTCLCQSVCQIVLLDRFGNRVWIFSFFQWFLRPWWTGGRRRCYYSETVLISSRDLHNATGICKKTSGSRACAYHLPGIWREQFLPTQQCAICWMYHCYMNFSTSCGKRDCWINEQMRLGKWNGL